MRATNILGACCAVFITLALALSGFIEQGLGQELNNKTGAASPDDDNPLYLPLVMRPTNLIYGHVTDNGAAATDIPLDLWQDDGSDSSVVMTTYTDTNGDYRFEGMAALGAGESYWVRYENNYDPTYLWRWNTRELTSFPDGSSVNLGSFDIADVVLTSPEDEGESTPPFTFQWMPRPATPTDSYQLNIYGNSEFSTAPLGYTGNTNLGSLPGGVQYCNPNYWEIEVHSPDGGLGISYGFPLVAFHENALAGIHGCVAEDGEPVSDVTVELRRFSTNGNDESMGTATTSNGYFEFTDQPDLSSEQEYYILFENDTNTNRLWVYWTRSLFSYTAGSAAFIADFDIKDIHLNLPGDNEVLGLPATFDWDERLECCDEYEFDLYDPDDFNPQYIDFGDESNYSLTALPSGFSTGVWYAWEVWVYAPWGGTGTSFETRTVSFSSMARIPAPGETPEHGRIDYQWVRARQNSRMSLAQPRWLLNRQAEKP